MKRYLFASVCILFCLYAFSQDTIITNSGDTIACKITRISPDFIHFSVFDRSGILLMRSRLPLSSVHSYNQNDLTAEDEQGSMVEAREEDTFIPDLDRPPKFRLALNGGFSYQFAGYEGFPSSYTNQVRTLWNLGGDIFYYPTPNFGFGLRYARVFTGAEEDFGTPPNVITVRDERIRFNNYGLTLLYRNQLYEDNFLNYFLTAEIIHYRTDLLIDGVPAFESASTAGITFGGSYDVILDSSFGIGLGGSVTVATISEINANGNTVIADFPISRIDLSIGLRLFR